MRFSSFNPRNSNCSETHPFGAALLGIEEAQSVAMVDAEDLRQQLHREREERLSAVDQVRQLQHDVVQLRHDATRRENELETALLALSVYEHDQYVQDLVEHNIALREQVQSLKALVEHSVMHESSPKFEESPHDMLTEASPEQLISRNEVQQLLAKLAAKESQLQLLHQKCASWEQQVIELKFEVQSVKHTAEEQEEVARIAQHSVVRQECCQACRAQRAANLIQSLKLEKKTLAATISPKAPRTDLEHYKSLAHLRGVFWLQALEQAEMLSSKLSQERRESCGLRDKMESMEMCHSGRAEEVTVLRSRLDKALSCCEVLERELGKVTDMAEKATEELSRLRLELDSERCERKTDKTRSARIIVDLRGELNKSLMDIEQLHNASIVFSPKNSRGIDSNRKSLVPVNPAA